LFKALESYAKGVLLDIGCGIKPYRRFTKNLVRMHFGVDHLSTLHARDQIDIVATAYETGVGTSKIDTILSTFVLEHLENPQMAIKEMHRILKPGGHVILTAPLFWHLHEEPRDFFRYTSIGLGHLFSTAGFHIVEIKPLAGFVVTFSQELVYCFNGLRRGPLRHLVELFQSGVQRLAHVVNRWDHSYRFSWAHLVVAQKPLGEKRRCELMRSK
jgi:SAM-dependent methyltransferase